MRRWVICTTTIILLLLFSSFRSWLTYFDGKKISSTTKSLKYFVFISHISEMSLRKLEDVHHDHQAGHQSFVYIGLVITIQVNYLQFDWRIRCGTTTYHAFCHHQPWLLYMHLQLWKLIRCNLLRHQPDQYISLRPIITVEY